MAAGNAGTPRESLRPTAASRRARATAPRRSPVSGCASGAIFRSGSLDPSHRRRRLRHRHPDRVPSRAASRAPQQPRAHPPPTGPCAPPRTPPATRRPLRRRAACPRPPPTRVAPSPTWTAARSSRACPAPPPRAREWSDARARRGGHPGATVSASRARQPRNRPWRVRGGCASRASRSSESWPRPAVSETPRPRRARRGRGRREHLARRPRRPPPSGRWRATTRAWQTPARALLSVTREARGSEAFTFRDARGLRTSIQFAKSRSSSWYRMGKQSGRAGTNEDDFTRKTPPRPIGGSTVTRGAHARSRPCLPTLATRDVSRTRLESASRPWLTNPTVQVGKRPTRSRCPRFSCLTTARPSSPPRPPPASGSGP